MQCRRSMTEREEVSLKAKSNEARELAGRGREMWCKNDAVFQYK